ncbi:monooxygenase, partial [Salmonella enterica subsp. enterica serovar Typhimurium]|nr:monooxygenase [Salmonella enterica subsp. enterica serovar Typhimurium]
MVVWQHDSYATQGEGMSKTLLQIHFNFSGPF